MNHSRRSCRRGLLAPTLLVLVATLLAACAASSPAAEIGAPAPQVQLATLGGDTIALNGSTGRARWLVFWASWCAPCREEWPALSRAAVEFESELELISIAVNQSPATVETFVATNPASFAVAIDPEGQVAERFRVVGLPTHVLIDRDGTIRHIVRGPLAGPRAATLLGLSAAQAKHP